MASIRNLIVDAIEARLAEITEDNGYSRQVGASRVYPYNRIPTKLPQNSVVVYASGETIQGPVANDRYECKLYISVGFATSNSARDRVDAGEAFLADVQTCMGRGFETPDNTELTISTTNYGTGNPATIIAEVLEVANEISESDAMPGMIVGQVDYEVTYWRNMHRPDRI